MAVAKRGAQDGQGCRSPPWVMARWNCAGLRAPATSRRRKRRPFSTPTLDEQAHYEAEAIRMADDSHYGLADYIWTQRYRQRAARGAAIESGWVQVRQGLGQASRHSYGDYKQSGIGREFSLEGMLESFTQRQKP
jgi:hypothetical protein